MIHLQKKWNCIDIFFDDFISNESDLKIIFLVLTKVSWVAQISITEC